MMMCSLQTETEKISAKKNEKKENINQQLVELTRSNRRTISNLL